VTAATATAGDARAELSALLRRLLDELLTGRRIPDPSGAAPAEVVLGAPTVSTHPDGASATVRVAVPARLEPTR
jgi:hypothetical protein